MVHDGEKCPLTEQQGFITFSLKPTEHFAIFAVLYNRCLSDCMVRRVPDEILGKAHGRL